MRREKVRPTAGNRSRTEAARRRQRIAGVVDAMEGLVPEEQDRILDFLESVYLAVNELSADRRAIELAGRLAKFDCLLQRVKDPRAILRMQQVQKLLSA